MKNLKPLGVATVAATVFVLTAGVHGAGAQNVETRGAVTAVSNASLTIKAGEQNLTFDVNADTRVTAPGAGRQTRQAREAGGTGIKLTDFIATGQAVRVTYRVANGRNLAVSVQPVSSAGTSGTTGSTSSEDEKIASGKVTSVNANALMITDNGKDWTFVIAPNTKLVARGGSTAAKAAGGRIPIADMVANGDTVSVSYRSAGGVMTATEVRVTIKAR